MKVTLYSTHCPKCNVLTQKLKMANVPFNEVDDIDIMLKKGFMSAPMLEVDNKTLDFTNAMKWIKERKGK